MDPNPVQRGLERDEMFPVASVISGLCKWGVVIARAPDGFARVFIASAFCRPQPGFPFSILIHSRTDTRGFANVKFEPGFGRHDELLVLPCRVL